MKTPLTLFALITTILATPACGGHAADELATGEAALSGVEPDEIDVAFDDSGDIRTTDAVGVEPDEIDAETEQEGLEPDEIDAETEQEGVEPDEIDVCNRDEESGDIRTTDAAGLEPDEIDAETEQEGVEPDEIDVCNRDEESGDIDAESSSATITYGPVITIKPKG